MQFFQTRTALVTLVAACLVVLISLSVRQVFGLFFIDFNNDLGISNTEFGLAIGIQMLGWGLSGPIFGAIADKYGGHRAIILAFLFYILGVYLLYNGPNTGIYFQISLGVLIGIGCGGTAISIPMSIVGKHFPLSNRTIAMSIVTAVGSFGYFLSPLFTKYSLSSNGWEQTLFIFMIFLTAGLVVAVFVRSPSKTQTQDGDLKQDTMGALKEAFQNKSYVLLIAGFFVCGFHITLVGTHVPKYVADRGLAEWTAAVILSLIGFFNIIGSLLSGYLSTKMSKKIILSVIYLLRGISICIFIFTPPSTIISIFFGARGIYWLPQRTLEAGGLTGGWGTIAQMVIGVLLLLPIALWRVYKKKGSGFELPLTGLLVGGGFICYALSFLLTDVIRALILFYMTPIWTTIFEILFLKRRPGWQRAVTLSLALAGLWIVFSKDAIIPLPQNAGDWIALAGGAIFAGGMIRLEVVKTDGVFPIIFSFFFYGTLFNIVAGFLLVDYLGETPPIESFIPMAMFLIVLSLFYFIPTGIVILWAPSKLGAGLCSILFLTEIVVGVVSSSILTDEPFGWREIVGSSMIILGGILAVVLAPKEDKKITA